jgi:CDGSH-type Zn-finger protein
LTVDVQAGEIYWWCRYGLNKQQPFCDGSHKGSEFSPLKYSAAESQKLWFCGCKQTRSAPLCDGSHKSLSVDAP